MRLWWDMTENGQTKLSTRDEMEREVAACRTLFEKKTHDYGTSWRILRLPSLTDQIFIKANRIRSVQESGENRVGDGVRTELESDEWKARNGEAPMELPLAEAMKLYDKHITRILDLMMAKNHDYGEAWRQMRIGSMVDLILMKLLRIKQIEDNDGRTLASEGVEGGYMDIVNYSLFSLVRLTEEGVGN